MGNVNTMIERANELGIGFTIQDDEGGRLMTFWVNGRWTATYQQYGNDFELVDRLMCNGINEVTRALPPYIAGEQQIWETVVYLSSKRHNF